MIAWLWALPWVRKTAAIAGAVAATAAAVVAFAWSQRRAGAAAEKSKQRDAALKNVRTRNEVERDNRRPDVDLDRELERWLRD